MAKIKDVTIINSSTIKLNVDCKKDDIIDLNDLNSIDSTILLEKINSNRDEIYNKKIEELKLQLEKDKKNEIAIAVNVAENKLNEEINKKELEINELKNKILTEADSKKSAVELAKQETEIKYNTEKQDLSLKLQELQSKLDSFENQKKIELDNLKKELELVQLNKVNELNNQIISLNEKLKSKDLEIENAVINKTNDLNNEITTLNEKLKSKDLEIENAVMKKVEELNKTISEKDFEINKLTLAKSSTQIKMLGEQLEVWCNNEFNNYALCGFDNTTWYKDNTSVKGDDDVATKADYIFKVYATEDKKDVDLLTSVCCEMKNESPTSKTKKKNSDHYLKLDKDRIKKGCEYALLVSELEWNSDNDVPIKKVPEYEKMYVVRPQYFITFLSIVYSFGMKYKDLLVNNNLEKEKFKDSQVIIDEFDKFKEGILNKLNKKLTEEVDKIVRQSESIKKSADTILSSAEEIKTKVIADINKRIENYNITKLVKKINKIEED